MNYLISVIRTEPLTIHFSIQNPDHVEDPVLLPRMLEPLGAFVSVVVYGPEGAEVCRTHQPKFTPKLKPSQADSYVELDPGYSYGVVFEIDDCKLPPGNYEMEVLYSNLDYQGTEERPIGELSHRAKLPLVVD